MTYPLRGGAAAGPNDYYIHAAPYQLRAGGGAAHGASYPAILSGGALALSAGSNYLAAGAAVSDTSEQNPSNPSLAERIKSIAVEVIATVGAFFWGITVGVTISARNFSFSYRSIQETLEQERIFSANPNPSKIEIFSETLSREYARICSFSEDKYEDIKSYFYPVVEGEGF